MSEHVREAGLKRVPHSASQLKEAASLGDVRPSHRETRRSVVTHAIDNVTPDIISDRDDGIRVELNDKPGGGYRVVVTIADVAAHVPIDSQLALVAHERAFTRYRPSGNDPMFPQELEHRMSLEHGEERLGLNVVMDLDAHYQLTHTSFEPVIATPDNADYEMANERVQSDDQFAHMNEVAKGIFHYMFSDNVALLKDTGPVRAIDEALTDQALESSLMVASYMLLANHAVASFFQTTGLPFAYRNFDGTHKSKEGIERAFYDTNFTAHTELEKSGLKGAYSHFTSPIRRGPDFYNAHMVHYVYELYRNLYTPIVNGLPDDKKIDETVLWKAMPTVLCALTHYQQQPAPTTETELAEVLLNTFKAVTGTVPHGHVVERMSNAIRHVKPPVTQQALKDSLIEINTLSDQERDNIKMDEAVQSSLKMQERKAAINSYTDAGLAAMDKQSFSSALRNCAKTGELPDIVYEEAMGRLKAGKLSKAVDAMHVMMDASEYQHGHWRDLKKAFAVTLKEDTGTVNNILFMAEYFYDLLDGQSIQTDEATLPLVKGKNGERPETINAAILHTSPEEKSAPFYSLGHDSRAAVTHARYSFLEHYAFDELRPLEEASAPDLLYADLKSKNKRKIVQAIVEPRGGKIVTDHREYTQPFIEEDEKHLFAVKVEGGDFDNVISASAYGATKKEAEKKAYRKMLRKPELKEIAQFITPQRMYNYMHPYQAVAVNVDKADGLMRLEVKPISNSQDTNFMATLHIDVAGQEFLYEAEGVNKSRAINAVSTMALISNSYIGEGIPQYINNSWVADVMAQQGGGTGEYA